VRVDVDVHEVVGMTVPGGALVAAAGMTEHDHAAVELHLGVADRAVGPVRAQPLAEPEGLAEPAQR
jgi:hypothetical protein